MKSYVPATHDEQMEMLEKMGCYSIEDLFLDIPKELRLKKPLDLPPPMPERDVLSKIKAYAMENHTGKPLFRGAGANRHFIPSFISALISRGELLTAYTPYQFEMSQGMLQAIFEYQTLIARLTGLNASNASVYDGATAAAEAMLMARDITKKKKILVSAGLAPDVLATLRAYAPCASVELVEIPCADGATDIEKVKENAAGSAGLIFASPNYFGIVEDGEALADVVHTEKGLLVAYVNPISLGLLKTPGAYSADIAVGDGQPLGIPLSWGGPYLGFMAARQKYLRNLPGRIVGETVDAEGTRAYVLTLQAREQHIRREKAASNICSNQSLCAIMAAMYLNAMGPQGLREVAEACLQKAHYTATRIQSVPGLRLAYQQPFFHEFVIESKLPAKAVDQALYDAGIVGGLPVGAHQTLFCVTEMNTLEEIDQLVQALEVMA